MHYACCQFAHQKSGSVLTILWVSNSITDQSQTIQNTIECQQIFRNTIECWMDAVPNNITWVLTTQMKKNTCKLCEFSEIWEMWTSAILSAVSQRRRSGWVQALLTWPDQPARVRVDDANSCAIVARPDDSPEECIFVNATSGCWTIFEVFTTGIYYAKLF